MIWFGYEFFLSNLWRYNFIFYLLLYNGVRIFPVLYAMNFSPAGQFFFLKSPIPLPPPQKSTMPVVPQARTWEVMPLLCPFLFSSHVSIGGEVAREEKNYCSSLLLFFFGQIRISSNTVFLHLHGPLGEIFPSIFCACVSSIVLFCQTVTFCDRRCVKSQSNTI